MLTVAQLAFNTQSGRILHEGEMYFSSREEATKQFVRGSAPEPKTLKDLRETDDASECPPWLPLTPTASASDARLRLILGCVDDSLRPFIRRRNPASASGPPT